jgi:hypothetical protein
MITARSKKTGKVFKGKLAALMQRIGVADPFEISAKLSASEVVAQIKECETIEDLLVWAGDTRKTVKAAFEKKFKELS